MTWNHPDTSTSPQSFFEFTRAELSEGLDRDFRATQLYEAVYKHWIDDLDQLTNLPKSLRNELKNTLDIRLPPIHRTFEAADGTRRHLIQLGDGEMAETVFIPDGNRNTICVSSQVGCGLACTFCLTGQLGFKRHLTAGEIVSQVLVAERQNISEGTRGAGKLTGDTRGVSNVPPRFNIVLMGMGEPLHNYDNVMKALAILNDPAGLNMSMSRITLSTVGLIPEIERLGNERLIPNLAVSLTGATDKVRNRLMPINKTYPIAELIRVLRRFPFKPRQRVTLEYVLLEGVTDSPSDAGDLARVAHEMRAKVNLIPLNEAPELQFKRGTEGSIARFQRILRERGVQAFIRKSRGDDISAACGQLAKKWADAPPEIDLEALKI